MKGHKKLHTKTSHKSKLVSECRAIPDCAKMAEALYHEARGEGVRGMIEVTGVILHRAKAGNKSIHSVILAPGQFSYLQKKKLAFEDDLSYVIAYEAWRGTIRSKLSANHYANLTKVKKRHKWMQNRYKVGKIGAHTFYYIPEVRNAQ